MREINPRCNAQDFYELLCIIREAPERLRLNWLRCQGCFYCKRMIKTLTRDHIVAKSLGGKTQIENLVYACDRCNSIKEALTVKDFDAKCASAIAYCNKYWMKRIYWCNHRVTLNELHIIKAAASELVKYVAENLSALLRLKSQSNES